MGPLTVSSAVLAISMSGTRTSPLSVSHVYSSKFSGTTLGGVSNGFRRSSRRPETLDTVLIASAHRASSPATRTLFRSVVEGLNPKKSETSLISLSRGSCLWQSICAENNLNYERYFRLNEYPMPDAKATRKNKRIEFCVKARASN
jgi:hypothetical protein